MQKKSVSKSNENLETRKNLQKTIETTKSDSLQYIVPREESLAVSNLKNAQTLLSFKLYSKKQNYDRFKHRSGISIYKKYKMISTDLKKRLHVTNPIDDVLAVIDIDKDFYRYIDGRPLHRNVPVFRSLKNYINDVFRLNQEIGNKKDYYLNIEAKYRKERYIYDLALQRLTYQAKCFDTFISEDYQKSMDFLSKCDKLRSLVDEQTLELQSVAIEKFTIMSKLIGLEYKYGVQQKYGRFLYYLSPPSWRLNNRDFARSVEIEAKGFDFGHSSEEDTFAVLFERMRKICYEISVRPVLYFDSPNDLMNVFETMETQQLYYYTHVNHLTPYAKILKNGIKSLKEIIFQESALVRSSVNRFECLLHFTEQRCAQLEEKFFNILYGLFYETVSAPGVLKLTLHLQFCYERVFSDKPINMSIMGIAKGLEKFYMDYSKQLDSIKSDPVRRAMTRCMDMGRLKIKRAHDAAKELRLFYRLERELLGSHGILIEKTYKAIKSHKKKIVDSTIIKLEKEKNSLTEAELEYLRLFTNWTANEDPANYLMSLKINKN